MIKYSTFSAPTYTTIIDYVAIGNIITDDFARASLGANWDIASLSTVAAACDGSKLTLTHTGANAATEAVLYKDITSLERWEAELIFTPSVKDANSYGGAIRFSSTDPVNAFHMSVQLGVSTNGTYGGLCYISNNATNAVLYQCATKINITAGCSYKLRCKREKNTFTIYAENLTDHSSTTGTYTKPIDYTQTNFLINTGKIGFQTFAGANMTYDVTSFIINSEALSNPKTSVAGDSISAGLYCSADITDRYFDKLFLTGNTKYNLFASGGEKIAGILTHKEELVRWKCTYAMIMIGANDTPTNHATWQTSYETLLDYLIANSVIPIVCKVTPQTTDITWMNTIIDSICATRSVKVIDTFTPLKAVADNTLHASYDRGDHLHINPAGHLVIKNTILAAAPELI